MQGLYKLGAAGSEVLLSGNDCALDVSHDLICRESRMASGALRRDVIAVKRTWTFRYDYLPGKKARVYDGGMGRDELRTLYATTGYSTSLSFHVPTEDGVEEDVTVNFVAGSWKEKLIQREGPLGTVYELSFGLVEV